jgi:hypothetical protein
MDFSHFGGLKYSKISQNAMGFAWLKFLYRRTISIAVLGCDKKVYFEAKDLWWGSEMPDVKSSK